MNAWLRLLTPLLLALWAGIAGAHEMSMAETEVRVRSTIAERAGCAEPSP